MQRQAVGDRAHPELAHAEVDVVARRRRAVTSLLPDQIVRTEPVRSAEPPISSGSAGANASIAFCEALRVATSRPSACARNEGARLRGQIRRQVARACGARIRRRGRGCAARYAAKRCVPGGLGARAALPRVPAGVDLGRESRTADGSSRAPRASPRLPSRPAPRRAPLRCPPCSARRCR